MLINIRLTSFSQVKFIGLALLSSIAFLAAAKKHTNEYPDYWPKQLVTHALSLSSGLPKTEQSAFVHAYTHTILSHTVMNGTIFSSLITERSKSGFEAAIVDIGAKKFNFTPISIGYQKKIVKGQFIKKFEGYRFIQDGFHIDDFDNALAYRIPPAVSLNTITPERTYWVEGWVSPKVQLISFGFGHLGALTQEIIVLSVNSE